jgi:hypothetical protein
LVEVTGAAIAPRRRKKGSTWISVDVACRPETGGQHSPKWPFEHATPACYHGTWLYPQDAVPRIHGENLHGEVKGQSAIRRLFRR